MARRKQEILFSSFTEASEFDSISAQWGAKINGHIKICYDQQYRLPRIEFTPS